LSSVWTRIIPSLGHVQQVFVEHADITAALRKFTLKLVTPAVERVGWDFAPDEDYLMGQLRGLLINQAGRLGHEGVVAEARKRFAEYIKGAGGHPSLRSPVFRVVVSAGGDEELDQVLTFYKETALVDGREVALQAMGSVGTPERARRVLDFVFSDAVAVQDKHSAPSALAANGKVRAVLWPYVKEHWEDKVLPQLSGNMVVLERFLKNTLNKYASLEVERDITDFFKDKDCKGFDRGLSVITDTIVGAANYKKRDEENLREYLKSNGYM
jgi:aminopeptidase N